MDRQQMDDNVYVDAYGICICMYTACRELTTDEDWNHSPDQPQELHGVARPRGLAGAGGEAAPLPRTSPLGLVQLGCNLLRPILKRLVLLEPYG